MNLFRYLKENMLLNQLKDTLNPSLHTTQNIITQYVKIGENKIDLLSMLIDQLNIIVNIFKDLDFDYSPELVPDEDEDVYINILDKFKEQISYFLNNFNEDLFEQFNVQVQYILNLTEVHKINFNKEDLTLEK